MRVIAGEAKGHRLKFLRSARLRPTSDKVKEAIFSALDSLQIEISRVLDLYAGTGSLGIEALSRGAVYADFVEKESKFCAIIKENLAHTKMTERSHVYCTTAEKALSFLKSQYSLILLDPPYKDPSLTKLINRIAGTTAAGHSSVIVAEHSEQIQLADSYGPYTRCKLLHHGDTEVDIYQYVPGGTS